MTLASDALQLVFDIVPRLVMVKARRTKRQRWHEWVRYLRLAECMQVAGVGAKRSAAVTNRLICRTLVYLLYYYHAMPSRYC